MSSVKKITVTALCVALCVVLPMLFHALNLGQAFSPLHIPVLLCGLVCGPLWGLVCGVAGPVVSSLITGMPPVARLVYFIPELIVYGVVSGLLYQVIRTGRTWLDLYLSLIPAMLAGRIVGGVAQALFMMASAKEYTVSMWASAYLAGTVPGIILHLVLIPLVVAALEKARLIPARYGKN